MGMQKYKPEQVDAVATDRSGCSQLGSRRRRRSMRPGSRIGTGQANEGTREEKRTSETAGGGAVAGEAGVEGCGGGNPLPLLCGGAGRAEVWIERTARLPGAGARARNAIIPTDAEGGPDCDRPVAAVQHHPTLRIAAGADVICLTSVGINFGLGKRGRKWTHLPNL